MATRLGITAVVLLVGLGLVLGQPWRSVAAAQSSAGRPCPLRISEASRAKATGTRSGSALPVHSLESIRICRYFGEPEFGLPPGQKAMVGQLARQRLLVGSATIRRLAGEVDRLSLFPATPGGGISCPGENGASMYLLFHYRGGVRSFIVLLNGCPRLFAPARSSPVYNLSLRLKHGLEALLPLRPA